MRIGDVAAASGVSAKMIRHYERIGLVPPAGRRGNSYRDYGPADVHRLLFVRRARDLGFGMDQVRALLRLWSDRDRASAEVKAIALRHVADLETRIAAMREMADSLHHLAEACHGNARPECPILRGLAGGIPDGAPPGPVAKTRAAS